MIKQLGDTFINLDSVFAICRPESQGFSAASVKVISNDGHYVFCLVKGLDRECVKKEQDGEDEIPFGLLLTNGNVSWFKTLSADTDSAIDNWEGTVLYNRTIDMINNLKGPY